VVEYRRNVFWMFQTLAGAVLPKPGNKCRKVMRAMDRAFADAEDHLIPSLSGQVTATAAEARTILRLRCALCTSRCKGPLA
jgi:hypothetical protein